MYAYWPTYLYMRTAPCTGYHQGSRRAAPVTLCTGTCHNWPTQTRSPVQQASKLQQRRATKNRLQPHAAHSFLQDFQPSATATALLGGTTADGSTNQHVPDYRVLLQEIYNLLDHNQSPASNSTHQGWADVMQDDATPRDDVCDGDDTPNEQLPAKHLPSKSTQCDVVTAATQTDSAVYNNTNALWEAIGTLREQVQSLQASHTQLQRALSVHSSQVGDVLAVVQNQLSMLAASAQHSGHVGGWGAWQPVPAHPQARPQ